MLEKANVIVAVVCDGCGLRVEVKNDEEYGHVVCNWLELPDGRMLCEKCTPPPGFTVEELEGGEVRSQKAQEPEPCFSSGWHGALEMIRFLTDEGGLHFEVAYRRAWKHWRTTLSPGRGVAVLAECEIPF